MALEGILLGLPAPSQRRSPRRARVRVRVRTARGARTRAAAARRVAQAARVTATLGRVVGRLVPLGALIITAAELGAAALDRYGVFRQEQAYGEAERKYQAELERLRAERQRRASTAAQPGADPAERRDPRPDAARAGEAVTGGRTQPVPQVRPRPRPQLEPPPALPPLPGAAPAPPPARTPPAAAPPPGLTPPFFPFVPTIGD